MQKSTRRARPIEANQFAAPRGKIRARVRPSRSGRSRATVEVPGHTALRYRNTPTAAVTFVVARACAGSRCAECVAGATNRCQNYDEFGFTRDGAAADLLVAPARLVHTLEPHVSWESGALVEPAAVVYRALDRARPAAGTRVLVVGDGTVALLTARLARLWEPSEVTMLGARPAQAALAEWAGVDRFTCDPADAGAGYGLVVEAAGAAAATAAALAAPPAAAAW